MNVKGFNRCDECRRSGVELNFAGTQLLCEPCASGNGSTCSAVLADHTIKREKANHYKDKDKDEGEDNDKVFPPQRPPCPSSGFEELSPLEWLDVLADNLTPVKVQLGELPPRAGRLMHEIAKHMELLMGIRLAAGDLRPLPYAASMAVRAGISNDKTAVAIAIKRMVEYGTIVRGPDLPPRKGMQYRTRTYAPPLLTARNASVDGEE